MKLERDIPTIESSEDLEEKLFSIGDPGFIFDILRSKMYSNPIAAICREISCNARDAHREVGSFDLPIQIYLPNNIEPFYKIKDFGPGISPDRMEHVFIRYGVSTKRESDVYVGAFGLGAKTPFSLVDSFTIVTTYNNIQYNYVCFIDETKVGKLALLSSVPTTECNGTEIIIPVDKKDFASFADETYKATCHWDVLPIIKGGTIDYNKIDPYLKGDDWFVVKEENYYNRYSVKLIIDGIEYPLDTSILDMFSATLIKTINGCLYLRFNTGELSLSANREQVYLDDKTKDKISSKITNVGNLINIKVQEKINSFDNYYDAHIHYYYELSNVISPECYKKKVTWRGHNFLEHYMYGVKPITFIKKTKSYSNEYTIKQCNSYGSFSIDKNSLFVINDLDMDPSPKSVKKFFENNKLLQKVYVLNIKDKDTEEQYNKLLNLKLINPVRLSTVISAPKKKVSSRLIVFKLMEDATFKQVSAASINDDTNVKVICKLNDGKLPLINNQPISPHIFLESVKDISIYGVNEKTNQSKYDESFSDFIDLEEYLKSKFKDREAYIKYKFVYINYCHLNAYYEDYVRDIIKLISQDSLYSKMANLHITFLDLHKFHRIIDLYELINGEITSQELEDFLTNNPDFDIKQINYKCKEKYPLLEYISSYRYHNHINHIANYIKLIDNSEKKED